MLSLIEDLQKPKYTIEEFTKITLCVLVTFEEQIRKNGYKMQNLLRLISTSYADYNKWLIKNRHLSDNLNSLDDMKFIG